MLCSRAVWAALLLLVARLQGCSRAVAPPEEARRLATSSSGWTRLMTAAYQGDVTEELMPQQGSVVTETHVNARAAGGETALHLAAKAGRAYNVKLLVSARAQVDLQDGKGRTALMYALRGSFDKEPDRASQWDVLTVLLAAKADVNLKDRDGFTALMYAAALGGNADFVAKLLFAGAEPLAENNDGKTADQIAKDNGHTEVHAALSRASANAIRWIKGQKIKRKLNRKMSRNYFSESRSKSKRDNDVMAWNGDRHWQFVNAMGVPTPPNLAAPTPARFAGPPPSGRPRSSASQGALAELSLSSEWLPPEPSQGGCVRGGVC